MSERTYKLKLLAQEPQDRMIEMAYESACHGEGPSINDDFPEAMRHIYADMHAAAPNDATKRLIAVLMEARKLLHYVPLGVRGRAEKCADDIDSLIVELCDD